MKAWKRVLLALVIFGGSFAIGYFTFRKRSSIDKTFWLNWTVEGDTTYCQQLVTSMMIMISMKNGIPNRLHFEESGIISNEVSLWLEHQGERINANPFGTAIHREIPTLSGGHLNYRDLTLTAAECKGRRIESESFIMERNGNLFTGSENKVGIKHFERQDDTFIVTYTNDESCQVEAKEHNDRIFKKGFFFVVKDCNTIRPWKGIGYAQGDSIALLFYRIARDS